MKHHTTSHYDFNCGPLSTEIDAAERRIRGRVLSIFIETFQWSTVSLSHMKYSFFGEINYDKTQRQLLQFWVPTGVEFRPSLVPWTLSIVIPLSAAVAA